MATLLFPKDENLRLVFSREETTYVNQVIRTQVLKIVTAVLALALVTSALLTASTSAALLALLLPASPLFIGILGHGIYRLRLFLELRRDHRQFLRRYGRLY